MFCPNCESEYREGFTRCADCDVDLVDRLEAPRAHAAALTLERSSEVIGELVERLEKAGVPYAIEAGTALDLLDDPEADFDAPDEWIARVWVAKNFEERAKRILEDIHGRLRQARMESD